ncbi:MAG: peptide ABC transporter ATP-binding protein [Waddliaceae bacterium]|nr:peptide ABC transporter ATP-binding protein [Waddliaceae bacterium]
MLAVSTERQTLLSVKGLKQYFPITSGVFRNTVAHVKAVDDVSFSLKAGEVLGLVGESGSGKSTVGRAALRLIEPTAGEVYFEGKDLLAASKDELRHLRQDMQMIFQDPYSSLNPRKTIGEALEEPLAYHGIIKDHEERRNYVEEIIDKVGLRVEALDRYPHEFSGGQQQRICIARSILLKPKMIVCDEAVSALDVSVQAQILNLLHELKESMGFSYLFISHDLSVVRHICDRVLVMYLGKIVEEAPVEELFRSPKHPYTQALLSATPKEHPDEEKIRLSLKGEMPSPINPPKGCPFHPRCPFAEPVCKVDYPLLKEYSKTHGYYCIRD